MAGEFARDGDRDDGAALAAPLERMPAGVETAGASVGAGTLPAARKGRALAQRPQGGLSIEIHFPLIPFAMPR